MHRSTSRLVAAVTLAAASVAVASTAAAANGPSPETQPSSGELVDVRVGNFGHSGPTTLILQYADEAGIFERNGINYIEEAPIYNAAQISQQVEQGQADVGIIGPSGAVPLIALGRPLTLVGNLNIGMALHIVVNNDAAAALEEAGVTPESPVEEKVQALSGLTIGVAGAGSATDTALRYLIEQYGLDPDSDLLLQPFGDNASLIAAGREAAVDGIATIAGSGGTGIVADGLGVELVNFGVEDPVISAIPVYAVVANNAFIEDNPEAVISFLQSLQEARADITAGLDEETIAVLKERFAPDMEEGLYQAALESALPAMTAGDIVPLPEQAQAIIDVYNSTADDPVELTFEELYRVDLAETALERATAG